MPGIITVPPNTTTSTVEEHYLFTLVRVRRCALTTTLIPEVEAFQTQINAAIAEERILREADMEASAGVHFVGRKEANDAKARGLSSCRNSREAQRGI
jgi:hypothetical protein